MVFSPNPTLTHTPFPGSAGAGELLECRQDGCIYSYQAIFGRPIPEGFNQHVEKTYRYGTTQFGGREIHHGVEFMNPTGTPVIAAGDGIVEFAGNDFSERQGGSPGFYGNLVIIRHQLPGWDFPVYSLYAHLSKIHVATGDPITRGQLIAEVGKSGSASGSHLHFEIRVGSNKRGATANPELWIQPVPSTESPLGTLIVKLNLGESSIYTVEIILQDYTDPNTNYHRSQYAESYSWGAHSDPFWQENLVWTEIKPGTYRVSLTREGRRYQKFVEIEPERITLVEFDIDY